VEEVLINDRNAYNTAAWDEQPFAARRTPDVSTTVTAFKTQNRPFHVL